MSNKLSQIFKKLPDIEPQNHLEALIMQKIGLEKEKGLQKKLFFSYASLTVSGLVLLGAISIFGQTILQSEFWSILSLLFSDLAIVFGNLSTYLYSLMETFPVINLLMLFIPAFTLFLSFDFFLSLKQRNQSPHSFSSKFKFI